MKRSLLHLLLGVLTACLLWGCATAIKGRVVDGRYISENREFSVALDQEFGPTFEMQYEDHTSVELDFKREPAFRGVFGFETIEWLPLRATPSLADFDSFAPGLIEEHVSKRLAAAGGSFKLTQSQRLQDENAPTWRFVAQGSLNGKPALWRGQVMLLGDRIAIPSHVGYVDNSPYAKAPKTDFPDTLVTWLRSVRRER